MFQRDSRKCLLHSYHWLLFNIVLRRARKRSVSATRNFVPYKYLTILTFPLGADETRWKRGNGWYVRPSGRDGRLSSGRTKRGRPASRRRGRTRGRTSSSRLAVLRRVCWSPPIPVALLSGAHAELLLPPMSWCSPRRSPSPGDPPRENWMAARNGPLPPADSTESPAKVSQYTRIIIVLRIKSRELVKVRQRAIEDDHWCECRCISHMEIRLTLSARDVKRRRSVNMILNGKLSDRIYYSITWNIFLNRLYSHYPHFTPDTKSKIRCNAYAYTVYIILYSIFYILKESYANINFNLDLFDFISFLQYRKVSSYRIVLYTYQNIYD